MLMQCIKNFVLTRVKFVRRNLILYRSKLKKHERSKHTDGAETRIFECESCEKDFKSKRYLKIHVDKFIILKLRPYECLICEATFSCRGNLTKHNESIHEKKRFPCSLCEKNFSQKSYLNTHIKTVHNKEKL